MNEITINELFAGIGAQASAFERLNIPHRIINISDIDHNAVLAYASIHCGLTEELINTYTEYPTREEMARQLTEINLGYDFQKNKSYNWYRFVNSKSKELEKYWLANKLSKNLGDISRLERLEYADFWTYSFPCTDISLSGKQEGIKQGETRSGLLYEVQRLLEQADKMSALPKYLMLENVKNLVGKQFKSQFDEWLYELNDFGYNTYWKVLNAKDYGVPQNRERVFAISIRKDIDDGKFEFPQPFDNGVRLKDVLEDNVDEKYYLTDTMIRGFIKHNENHTAKGTGFIWKPRDVNGTASTLRANGALAPTDNTILETNRCIQVGNLNYYNYKAMNRVCSKEGISPTLTTMQGGNRQPKIAEPIAYVKEATKKGYAEIYEGDSVNIAHSNSKTRKGRVGKGCAQTLTTICSQVVVEPINTYTEWQSKVFEKFIEDSKGETCGVITDNSYTFGYQPPMKGYANTLKTHSSAGVVENYRVRKLTPKECYRLMGFTDEQFDKSQAFSSDNQLYKQAGNSIVVDVLYYIFGKLFNIEVKLPKNAKFISNSASYTTTKKQKKLW